MISHVIIPDASLLDAAKRLVAGQVKPGDGVIDATLGNGHDSLFLLNLVKPEGKVYAFDLQTRAINNASRLLQTHPDKDCVTLWKRNHTEMVHAIPPDAASAIRAVMFNLGYLPGGDKSITTQADSTLQALTAASRLLSRPGVMTIMAYPGHEEGRLETEFVESWCLGLDDAQFSVTLYQNRPDNPLAPRLFLVRKIVGTS